MKGLTIAFLALAMCVALSLAVPSNPDLKELKKEAARKKACIHDCEREQYKPVCAGHKGDKPDKGKSFGSLCVMNNHNCEHNDKLEKLAEGQCPNAGGVRLS